MKQVGMILGKFAPFHRGHQHLIEAALEKVDHLIVVVYQALRTTSVPLSVRAGWIRTLYPQVDVVEAVEMQTRQDAFLREFLESRRIDVFFSGEAHGAAAALGLEFAGRLVDLERTAVPVSASLVRGNLQRYADFVHPVVRVDLVRRMVFLGGPSTGKTTLAQTLARVCREPWCPEFGRDYWCHHQVGQRLSMVDLEVIAREQVALERIKAALARGFLPIDTCPLTTLVYARYYFGCASTSLERTVRQYLQSPREYRLCLDDIPFEEAPDRSGPAARTTLQRLTVEALAEFGVPFSPVGGPLQERVQECLK